MLVPFKALIVPIEDNAILIITASEVVILDDACCANVAYSVAKLTMLLLLINFLL